jgi:hypothetical protein
LIIHFASNSWLKDDRHGLLALGENLVTIGCKQLVFHLALYRNKPLPVASLNALGSLVSTRLLFVRLHQSRHILPKHQLLLNFGGRNPMLKRNIDTAGISGIVKTNGGLSIDSQATTSI